MFPTRTGTQMGRGAFGQGLWKACDRAGIRRINPHLIRHTFATMYMMPGPNGEPPGSLENLRKILDHSTYQLVLRYVSSAEDAAVLESRHRSPIAMRARQKRNGGSGYQRKKKPKT